MHKSRGISSVSADSRAFVGSSLDGLQALPLQTDLQADETEFNMSMPMSFLHQPNPDYGAEEAETPAELEAETAEAETAGSGSTGSASETTEVSTSTSTSTSTESTSESTSTTSTPSTSSPWGHHTQVYGGGVCLACLAAGDATAGYGDSVPPEERSRE